VIGSDTSPEITTAIEDFPVDFNQGWQAWQASELGRFWYWMLQEVLDPNFP
jgi:hypothetical protein